MPGGLVGIGKGIVSAKNATSGLGKKITSSLGNSSSTKSSFMNKLNNAVSKKLDRARGINNSSISSKPTLRATPIKKTASPVFPKSSTPTISKTIGKSKGILSYIIKIFVFIVLFILIGALIIQSGFDKPLLPTHIISKAITGFFGFVVNFKAWISDFNPLKIWEDIINKQIAVATGGYYEGKVDRQRQGSLQNKELGIEIRKLTPQKSYFTPGEDDIVLWGDIRARMLDKGMENDIENTHLKTYCTIDLDNNDIIFSKNTEEYDVEVYGEEHTECVFQKEEIENKIGNKEGVYISKLHVKFNFETMAYLRTYFMEESRINMYRMQDKDPLKQYGVMDAHPISVYTSGPVQLAIGTNDEFPLKVPENNGYSTIFGLTIQNRNRMDGFIEKINSITLEIPNGLELDSSSCDFNFKRLGKEEDPYSHVGYDKYKVLLKDEKLTEKKISLIDDYLTIRCKLRVRDKQSILGDSAFAVQYLRAYIMYDYILSKSTTIHLKNKDKLRENNNKIIG